MDLFPLGFASLGPFLQLIGYDYKDFHEQNYLEEVIDDEGRMLKGGGRANNESVIFGTTENQPWMLRIRAIS